MDEKENQYFELQERYRVPGSPIKGIPRVDGYEGDLKYEQVEVAKIIVNFTGIKGAEFLSEPRPNRMPDVLINSNDITVGLEVTELVDEKIRRKHLKRRKAEENLGLNPLQANRLFIDGNHPLFASEQNGHISPYAFKEWNPKCLFCKLEKIICLKSDKLAHHKTETDFPSYDRFILGVYTGEWIDQALVEKALQLGTLDKGEFDEIYLILDYQSEEPNYPVIRLA